MSPDLRSLRFSDKLTARYFSVAKNQFLDVLPSIKKAFLGVEKRRDGSRPFSMKRTKTWPNGKTFSFHPEGGRDGLYNVSVQLFYNDRKHLKPWNSLDHACWPTLWTFQRIIIATAISSSESSESSEFLESSENRPILDMCMYFWTSQYRFVWPWYQFSGDP